MSTPAKIKAKELVDKFMKYADKGAALTKGAYGVLGLKYFASKKKDNAKQCALIAVDELLELAKKTDDSMNAIWKVLAEEEGKEWSFVKHFTNVKEEINKL